MICSSCVGIEIQVIHAITGPYRNPSGFIEKVKIVELPYCRDSRGEYLNTTYSDCESESHQDEGIGLLLALLGGVDDEDDDDDDDDDDSPSFMHSQLL